MPQLSICVDLSSTAPPRAPEAQTLKAAQMRLDRKDWVDIYEVLGYRSSKPTEREKLRRNTDKFLRKELGVPKGPGCERLSQGPTSPPSLLGGRVAAAPGYLTRLRGSRPAARSPRARTPTRA
jgi:hypothetical protein